MEIGNRRKEKLLDVLKVEVRARNRVAEPCQANEKN